MKNQVLYLADMQVVVMERYPTGKVKVLVLAYGLTITVARHELSESPALEFA